MKSSISAVVLSLVLGVTTACQSAPPSAAPAPVTPPASQASSPPAAPAAPAASATSATAASAAAGGCKALRQQAATAGSPEAVLRLLGEAQAACQEQLKGFTPEEHPVPWAVATIDLANVVTDKAILTGGPNAAQGIDEAIGLYRKAMTSISAERAPEVWAAAQMNLGSALQSRGIRTPREEGVPYLQEAVDRMRQALGLLTKEKNPQEWVETQNNLGLALAELGTRQGKPAGTPLLEEAFQAFAAVQTVYTFETQPRRWSEARLTQARVRLAQEKNDEASAMLAEILQKDPENRRALMTYSTLLAGRAGRMGEAADLLAKWLEKHPQDAEIQILHMENLFAAGRLAEARYRAVSLSEGAAGFNPSVQASLLGYEIATGLATGTKDAPVRLAALISLISSQPTDFRVNGNFAASLRFLQTRPDMRNSDWQTRLFHALQNRNGRDAMLAELQSLENEMAGGA